MSKIDEIRQQIAEKSAKLVALLNALKHSLAIEAFYPDAFKDGPCRVGSRSNPDKPWEGTVTFNGVSFPARDVPLQIWPPAMQAELRAISASKRPKEYRDA